MTLRHDAAFCRAQQRSELIRHSLGIETPAEKEKREAREAQKRKTEAKEAAKGQPLLGLE